MAALPDVSEVMADYARWVLRSVDTRSSGCAAGCELTGCCRRASSHSFAQREIRARVRDLGSAPAPGRDKGHLVHHTRRRNEQTNVIAWPALLEKFRREALGASLLAVCDRPRERATT
ncbi:hypothetical protein [Burkholderia gladioli]|uniref:hypothetical protein n=1 Tax=Burkholderia gladioli TaxID=28095 RepID=UPI001FC89673|nr:hypothetical protein [Burkholderia gladioli]